MNIKGFISKLREDGDSSTEHYHERKRLMKFNRFFSRYRVFTTAYFVFAAFVLVASAFLLNALQKYKITGIFTDSDVIIEDVSVPETVQEHYFIFIFLLIALILLYFKFAYDMRVSFGTLNVGQKGTAAWAARDDLEEQYKKVPEKLVPFAGMGGIPISRVGSHVYIDDTNVNSLIIGGTRSGKGQTIIEPMAEIISRAKEKCSMIITDPKMELANKMIPKLKEEGYETHILNLIDPAYSMGYNLLKLIVDEYKDGNIDVAQQLTASLGYNVIKKNEQERDPYFTDQARNVFIAFVMAQIEDNINLDKEQNIRWKHEHELAEDARERKYYENLYGEDYSSYVLKKFILKQLMIDGSQTDYELLNELKRDDVTKDFIDIGSINEDTIKRARLFKLKKSSFKRRMYFPSTENEKRINVYSIIKLCNYLMSVSTGDGRTALDDYFDSRPEDNFARITYGAIITASEATKGTIMSVFRGAVSVFGYDSIAKMTAENSIDFMDIGFGDKPVAIFIALPDYDKSNWFIATVFINQIYFILAKLATAMPGGKLYRRVHFILDEFGNIPPLDGFDSIITVCLGRNMLFTLAVQALSQLAKNYQEGADTIKGNCGNWIYIMTEDKNTAGEISEILGKETITTVNRTGKKLSATKELTEMTDEKPLLSTDELMRLKMGENIVLRFMFRESRGTKQRERIQALPIANLGEFHMKFAYEYLSDVFPQNQLLYISNNLKKIREHNPHLKNLNPIITDVSIEKTDHINLKEYSVSGVAILEYKNYLRSSFLPYEEQRSGESLIKMNAVLSLLNLSNEEEEIYRIAGTIDEDGIIVMPEHIITNGVLVDYGWILIGTQNKKIQEKGFKLLDIILPLEKKKITENEREYYGEIENEVLKEIFRKGNS